MELDVHGQPPVDIMLKILDQEINALIKNKQFSAYLSFLCLFSN